MKKQDPNYKPIFLREALASEFDSNCKLTSCYCCSCEEDEDDEEDVCPFCFSETVNIPEHVLKLHLDKGTPVFSRENGEEWVVYLNPSSFALMPRDSEEFLSVKREATRVLSVDSTFY